VAFLSVVGPASMLLGAYNSAWRCRQQGSSDQSPLGRQHRSQITPLASRSKMSAQAVASRAGSSFLGTPKASEQHSSSNNKQADMYISELLSYSLDRMRKVRDTAHPSACFSSS
jgi:hypothetical protein